MCATHGMMMASTASLSHRSQPGSALSVCAAIYSPIANGNDLAFVMSRASELTRMASAV